MFVRGGDRKSRVLFVAKIVQYGAIEAVNPRQAKRRTQGSTAPVSGSLCIENNPIGVITPGKSIWHHRGCATLDRPSAEPGAPTAPVPGST